MENMSTKPDGSSLIFFSPEQIFPPKQTFRSKRDSDLIMLFDSSEQSPEITKATVSLPGTMNGNGNTPHSASNNQPSSTLQCSKDLEELSSDFLMDKPITMSEQDAQEPQIILYFLQSSRSIRIAWLLEELNLDYKVVCYDREPTMAAPAAFKEACGGTMGKAPVLIDGDLVLEESGAITQ